MLRFGTLDCSTNALAAIVIELYKIVNRTVSMSGVCRSGAAASSLIILVAIEPDKVSG